MQKNISVSQISRYLTCPKSYYYYYVERLRERTTTAFLAFGAAMDAALNAILLDFKNNQKVTVDFKQIFDDNWRTIEINKRKHNLRDCTLVGYAKSDFVPELLTQEDLADILSDIQNLGSVWKVDQIAEIYAKLEELKSNRATFTFSEQDHKLLNILHWHSMRRKAHLMLAAYVEKIIPLIETVHEVQKEVRIESPCGTGMIGFVDAVVSLYGHEGRKTVLDNKTSSSLYDHNKLTFSQQLASYCFQLGIDHAAFAVMSKNINLNREKICSKCGHDGSGKRHQTCDQTPVIGGVKQSRCNGAWNEKVKPEATVQFLQGMIYPQTQQMVMDNAAEVLDAIKAKVFPRNLNTCQSIYGNPCSYLKKCWSNKEDNLERVE